MWGGAADGRDFGWLGFALKLIDYEKTFSGCTQILRAAQDDNTFFGAVSVWMPDGVCTFGGGEI